LTVRAVEELEREGGSELRVVPPEPEPSPTPPPPEPGTTSGTTETSGRRAPARKLPEPGVLELEDLLSTYLNTRVKVDIQNRRGRLVVEFATLEDLERIYRAMVGEGGVA
jgi:ParB family chromosome partitioning protein